MMHKIYNSLYILIKASIFHLYRVIRKIIYLYQLVFKLFIFLKYSYCSTLKMLLEYMSTKAVRICKKNKFFKLNALVCNNIHGFIFKFQSITTIIMHVSLQHKMDLPITYCLLLT